jgi:hypothetical protein
MGGKFFLRWCAGWMPGRAYLINVILDVVNSLVKKKEYRVKDIITCGRYGYVLIGAAIETPLESHGEYFKKLYEILNQKRSLSIQAAVHEATKSKYISSVHPPIAEGGVSSRFNSGGRKLAAILSNSIYEKPTTTLPTHKDGDNIEKQLKYRGYQTKRHRDQKARDMTKTLNNFINSVQRGDNIVVFYSGHGEMDGLQGVDNKFLAPSVVGGWMDTAFSKGFQLTVILEACHAGSIADHIRVKESTSIQKCAQLLGKQNAYDLTKIAQKLQQIKDYLSKVEVVKQKLMEKPLVTKLQKSGTLDQEIDKKDVEIQEAWRKEIVNIKNHSEHVNKLTGETFTLPRFSNEYTIKKGDNLSKILNKYPFSWQNSWQKLYEFDGMLGTTNKERLKAQKKSKNRPKNSIDNPNIIYPGDVILVPYANTWLSSKQLYDLDTMTNRTLELARKSLY